MNKLNETLCDVPVCKTGDYFWRSVMKNWCVFALGSLLSVAALAGESLSSSQRVGALPPIHQDIKDLKDMGNYSAPSKGALL